jgi:hypothetical protein
MCGGQVQRVMLAGLGRRNIEWKATTLYLDIPVRDRSNVSISSCNNTSMMAL